MWLYTSFLLGDLICLQPHPVHESSAGWVLQESDCTYVILLAQTLYPFLSLSLLPLILPPPFCPSLPLLFTVSLSHLPFLPPSSFLPYPLSPPSLKIPSSLSVIFLLHRQWVCHPSWEWGLKNSLKLSMEQEQSMRSECSLCNPTTPHAHFFLGWNFDCIRLL